MGAQPAQALDILWRQRLLDEFQAVVCQARDEEGGLLARPAGVGVGTLNGALVGAAIFRLLDFGLRRYLGESASFINGAIYVAIVLFLPYGVVGTWRLRSLQIRQGWERLFRMVGGTPH